MHAAPGAWFKFFLRQSLRQDLEQEDFVERYLEKGMKEHREGETLREKRRKGVPVFFYGVTTVLLGTC